MTNVLAGFLALFGLSGVIMHAEVRPARLDDTPPPPYTLPDPLVKEDGKRVRNVEEWRARREELLELFAREIYGRAPIGRLDTARAEVTSMDRGAVEGSATRNARDGCADVCAKCEKRGKSAGVPGVEFLR